MDALQALLDRWGKGDLPVLGATLDALAPLIPRGERASAQDIADIVLHDPLYMLNVLRAIAARKRGRLASEITTIEHAVMLFGAKPFFERFRALRRVEDVLAAHPDALLALRRTLSRAHHAACQAQDWAIQRQDVESEEVYVAAALSETAEAVLICLAPELAGRITEPMRSECSATPAEQQAALGFTLDQLRVALFDHARLPELLRSLCAPAGSTVARVQNVQYAVALARHSEAGWQGAALQQDYAGVAALLRLPLEAAVTRIHRTATLAARAWRWYRVPPAARWLPLLPPRDTAAAQAQPGFASTQEALAWAMQTLQQRARLRRVVFALRSPDGRHLAARRALGIAPEAPLANFQLSLARPHLFAQLLRKPACIWFGPGTRATLEPLLTPELKRIVGSGEFFASSIFLGSRPLGILYGDRRDQGLGALDEAAYAEFKDTGARLSHALAARAAASPPAAATAAVPAPRVPA